MIEASNGGSVEDCGATWHLANSHMISSSDGVGNESIGEVMVKLQTMDEVSIDLFKPASEIFISLCRS